MDSDDGTDTGRDGRWLAYAELAEVRAIDKPSAMKLALRHKWQRWKDNRGRMQIHVPGDWLLSSAPRTDKYTDLSQAMSAMNATLADEAAKELEAQSSRADRLEAEIGRERARAETALKLAEARATRTETAAGKWDGWLASELCARLKAVFWKA